MSNRIAVVFLPGAMRNVWVSGVASQLAFVRERVGAYLGSSSGAHAISLFATGQIEAAHELWVKGMTRVDIIHPRNIIQQGGWIGHSDMIAKMTLAVLDTQALQSLPTVQIGVSCLEDATTEYRALQAGAAEWLLKTTIAMPLVAPPTRLDGKTYVDGGVFDPLALRAARETGFQKVLIISNLPFGDCGEAFPWLKARAIFPRHQQAVAALQQRQMLFGQIWNEVSQGIRDGYVYLIAPEKYPCFRFERRKTVVQKVYEDGQHVGSSHVQTVIKWLEY